MADDKKPQQPTGDETDIFPRAAEIEDDETEIMDHPDELRDALRNLRSIKEEDK
ncbi:MAG: hypothetical protein H6739_11615 [Alphaproteobacteria bacterium]|nr:hypothetical protein [Alphaproteobacteria bacterium]